MRSKDDKYLFLIVIGAFLLLCFVLLDGFMARTKELNAIVLYKTHQASKATLQEVPSARVYDDKKPETKNYQLIYENETYEIIARNDNDNIFSLNTSKDEYNATNIGQTIGYRELRGFFTGLIWDYKLIKQ